MNRSNRPHPLAALDLHERKRQLRDARLGKPARVQRPDRSGQARLFLAARAIAATWLLVLLVLSCTRMMPLPFTGVPASMDVSAAVVGGKVHVAGTTDLFDGAVITIDVWPVSGADPRFVARGRVVVRGGQFGYDADVAGWPTVCLRILTRFDVELEGQAPKAVDRFGRFGSRLVGPDVYMNSGTRVLDNVRYVQCP
jgi:hypothetical protein